MPWNGNVTGSSVASIPQAHGPKEMDRVNRYFNDVDLEALAGDGSIATIRTKTRFRNNKFQFISDDGHIINFIIPTITNDKNITLPNDSGTLSLGGGGTPISTITNLGVGGVGVFKNASAGNANFYSLASISAAIDLALDAANNLIEIGLDETVINLTNLAGTLPISKGGTGQTTKTNAYDALSPTTTAGDIVYRNVAGDNVRLAIGPNGYVLGVVSGLPAWIPAPAGGGGGGGGGSSVTLHRNASVVDIVNTAAETNIFSFTIPAGTIGNTGLVKIIVTGSYLNNSGSDDQYDIRLKLGGTTIWQDSSGTQSTSANRRPVYLELYIKNNNSASSQKVGGTFVNGNAVLGDVGISDISDDEIRGESPIVTSASINTAADAVLALTIDHQDAHANISFQADIASVELIGGSGGGGTATAAGASGDVQYNNGSNLLAAEAAFNYDATNNQLLVPGLSVAEDLALTGVISPAQITANQNNYNPTDLATKTRLRLNTDASRNITGLTAPTSPADGSVKIITNVGSFNIVLTDEDALSTAGNRFSMGASLTLTPGKVAGLIYDNTAQRWRLIFTTVDQTGGGGSTPGGSAGDLQYNSGSSTFAAEAALTYDSTNDKLTVPGLKLDNELRLNGEISPAQITANQNNYNPTGLATAIRVRLSTDASRNITGLVPIGTSPDGEFKILTNVGSFNIVLTNEDALSTAANRFSFGANLTLAAGNTAIILYDANVSRWILLASTVASGGGGGAPTTARYVTMALDGGLSNEEVLTSGDGLSLTSGGANGNATLALDFIDLARKRVQWIEDFFNLTDKPNWIPLVTGTGAAVNGLTVGTEAAYGIAEVNSGTTATGESAIVFGHSATVKPIRLGAGILTIAFRIKIPTLSTSTQEFRLQVGLVDDPQTSGANNRVWLEYDRVNALFWTMITSSGGVNSSLDTSSTVGTAWTTIKIVINAAANNVEYFVDGTSVGTRTASIPTGVDLFPAVTFFKTVGTTARTVLVDYVAFDYDLTTAR